MFIGERMSSGCRCLQWGPVRLTDNGRLGRPSATSTEKLWLKVYLDRRQLINFHSASVPLWAYDIDQEFTYRPNDTLPSLPLSYMVPQILQHQTAGFTPQILAVEDTIQLNNSVFNFTITEAFDTNAQPVSSFSYYNNPFSSGCDITNMTAGITIQSFESAFGNITRISPDFTVAVSCHIPASFTLLWSGVFTSPAPQVGINPARDSFNGLVNDMFDLPRPKLRTFRVTVQPCCDCGSPGATPSTRLTPNQPPCSLHPARFKAVQLYIENIASQDFFSWQGPNKTDIFADLPSIIAEPLGLATLENMDFALF
ncbi:hypothetical protein B0H19DRAFT_1067633 [Mycena capillaripes]|nr:hypothetical protein B0H19DRAFT_1067633 [Mycena capillaripes]